MKILCLAPPGSGQLVPGLSLAAGLRARGHHVTWAVQPTVAARVRKAGFPVIIAGPDTLDFEDRDRHAGGHSQLGGWDEFLFTAEHLVIGPASAITCDVFREVRSPDFDIVIHDISSPAGAMLAELWKLPRVCVSTTSLCDAHPGLPPYAFEDELASGRSIGQWHAGHARIRDAYCRARRDVGLSDVGSGWNDLFSTFLTLQVTSPELEYPRPSFPSWLVFTGALTPTLPAGPLDPDQAAFLARFAREGRPLLYATLGTVFNKHPAHMANMIRGIAMSGRPALVSVGPGYVLDDALLRDVTDRMKIVRWADHAAILPRVHAAVTHGGMSTTSDTITFAVPTLHLPVGCDLPSLSRKIERCGAGIRLRREEASPPRIAQAIEQLMTTPALRDGVRRLQASYARLGGVERAVHAIEHAVDQATRRSA